LRKEKKKEAQKTKVHKKVVSEWDDKLEEPVHKKEGLTDKMNAKPEESKTESAQQGWSGFNLCRPRLSREQREKEVRGLGAITRGIV